MQLELIEISKKFGGKYILKDFSQKFSLGVTGILGLNGSGKSTLLKTISGLIQKDSGKVCLDGIEMNLHSFGWKRKIGYLSQLPTFYERMSVNEFLDYILLISKWDNKNARNSRIEYITAKLGLMNYNSMAIGYLSGGIRQRVAIAQSLIHDPQIYLLDEPMNNLDVEARVKFHDFLIENSNNKIILCVSHLINELEYLCSRILIMLQSKDLFYDSPQKLVNEFYGRVREITLNKSSYEKIKKLSVNILQSSVKDSEIIIRYDAWPNDFLDGKIVLPTLQEAFQCYVNLYNPINA